MATQYILHAPHDLAELVARTVAGQRAIWSRTATAVVLDTGDVLIEGIVRSWHEKQMAQESLRRVSGIGRIRNRLAVCR